MRHSLSHPRSRRAWERGGLILVILIVVASPALAQLTPPTLRAVRPLGAAPGEWVALEVRGTDLDGLSALLFEDPRIQVGGLELAKTEGEGPRIKATLAIPPDLAPGPLRFRAVTPRGISNPGLLLVGRPIGPVAEVEPNDGFRKAQVLATPVAVEGAIRPGDEVDLYAVEAKAGETLVAEIVASRAGSGLDALVTIFAPDGRELVAADDQFGRDAAASTTVPQDGRYLVQIQDADGRNRDDMIEQITTREYRLVVGRLPMITTVFPAGARRGRATILLLLGANLPEGDTFTFDVPADAPLGDHRLSVPAPSGRSNDVTLRVGDVPEVNEAEPNDAPASAPTVVVPAAINGTFTASGDDDLFRLKAAPGCDGDFAVTVYAARIGSPADPVALVLDDQGQIEGEDDDTPGRDARLERRIDAEKGVLVAVRDSFGRGGPPFVYRIEVEPIARRVAITADLGARTLPRRGSLAIPVTAERRGFDGAVTVLAGILPAGIGAAPITLPAKAQKGVLILTATADAPLGPFALTLAIRDVPGDAGVSFRERWIDRGGPREAPIESSRVLLAVAEPAPLGVAIVPGEVVVRPGGQAEIQVTLDRRDDSAKKAVKLRLLAGDGSLEGFEPVQEASVPADAARHSWTLKAKPDASPRRVSLGVRAWFDGSPDWLGADALPATLIVPEPPKTP